MAGHPSARDPAGWCFGSVPFVVAPVRRYAEDAGAGRPEGVGMKGIWIVLVLAVATLLVILAVQQARATTGRRRRSAWLAAVVVGVLATWTVVAIAL